ncbi:MAG: AraC family transcriptional regulator [Lachnospiraceae bacterium]|nr:AraC family transcriptional regulator [Lachnospiraceae bacterium]
MKKTVSNDSTKAPLFSVSPPYEMVYRNELSPNPAEPHSHNATELYYTLTDLPDVLLNDSISMIPAGTLIIIPTFCIHQLYHENRVVYERYILSIHTNWLKSVFCDIPTVFSRLEEPSPLFFFPKGEDKTELISHFEKLLKYEDKLTPDSLSSFFRFLSFFSRIIKSFESEAEYNLPISDSQKKVNEILAYIHEHIRDRITVTDIASYFYLNPDYLSRLFKKHMHIPISRYISTQRISEAESLLRNGLSVSQVQEELGFSSYAYFFKTFQKFTGVSPSHYFKL